MVPVTNSLILGGTSVGLGILYKVLASWTTPMGVTALNAFHLGNFAINFGTQHWVSLVAGPAMIMVLPRHHFGNVQSRLFPIYFHIQTITSASCLMAYMIKHPVEAMQTAEIVQAGLLTSCVSLSLLNLLVFGPKSTEVMFKRHKVEIEAGVGQEVGLHVDRTELLKDPVFADLNKRFNRLHAASMIANFGILGCSYGHLLSLSANGL